jgi:hypothetical protein
LVFARTLVGLAGDGGILHIQYGFATKTSGLSKHRGSAQDERSNKSNCGAHRDFLMRCWNVLDIGVVAQETEPAIATRKPYHPAIEEPP